MTDAPRPSRSATQATRVVRCRGCAGPDVADVLSLGWTPIANNLVQSRNLSAVDEVYPLGIQLCSDCSLVQLTHELPASVIFGDQYPYFSSYSDTFVLHAKEHANRLIRDRGLNSHSFVVEVGSNDGYLLSEFVAASIPTLGIDPCDGPVGVALGRGVPTIQEFFGSDTARAILDDRGPADVVIANNVLAHVPDLDDCVAGMSLLLATDGIVTIENQWVRDIVERLEFDTIYHEHYCYFSCASIERLLRRHGLYLNDVEYFRELHGGSLRWWFSHREGATQAVADLRRVETDQGIATAQFYERFATDVREIQDRFSQMLDDLTAHGATVAAYGAAAKGATLLNTSGVDRETVAFVVDRNQAKWGKSMPGCRIPVRPPAALLEEQPDYTILLAWNFATEVLAQQEEYQRRGGRFIVPVEAGTRRPAVLPPHW